MEIYIKEQLVSCLAFALLGILLGILYDAFRVLCLPLHREGENNTDKKEKNSRFAEQALRFICDILFGMTASVLFSVVSYAFSYGQFRLVSLICAAVGFAAYILTVGRLVMLLAEKLVHAVKCVCLKVVCLILRPIRALFRLFIRLISCIYTHTIGSLCRRIKDAGNKKRIMTTLERDIPKNVRFD